MSDSDTSQATGQPIAEVKRAARRAAQAARKAAHAAQGARAGEAASARFLTALDPAEGRVVSLFLPIGSELDTGALMRALLTRGCRLALPCVEGPARPLVFRAYRPGDALVEERFGTRAPAPEAEVVTPDILVVPLLAFDRAGYRLGYGGGFYDRTLEALRAEAPGTEALGAERSVIAAGMAYAAQEVPAVPREATDQPLDWIVTEERAFRP